MKSAIEEYFPIVDINHLAVPERNAFKPIYTMHKWFARRSSSVFRAILLGAMKPEKTNIMEDFYKDHTNDSDTKGKIILDPFMGGGTTIVEAIRLGCKVIGIDLNPIAWFIVKTEVEPVDLEELKLAFERLLKRQVEWSGKPLKETLLDLYKTECPSCGNKDADIIYTFWVKYAPCTTATCNHETALFNDNIILPKTPSIKYLKDCSCPKCNKLFDWELEPATLIGNTSLMVNASQYSGGIGRENKRWVYGPKKSQVNCPWCDEKINPITKGEQKPDKKKVTLTVLYCPHCEEVWQYRGEIRTTEIECPTCKNLYNPNLGNVPTKGKFICKGTCNGNLDNIISSIRKLPSHQPLVSRPYAIEGYCPQCAGKSEEPQINVDNLFGDSALDIKNEKKTLNGGILYKNSGKFFKRFTSVDSAKYQNAKEIWKTEQEKLPYPKSEIPVGEKTKSGLLAHHYTHWHQMFNERQLLALSTLLKAIDEEKNQVIKEMLLLTFSHTLEANNFFTRTLSRRNTPGGTPPGGIFSRHDYQPKSTIGEQNVFGTISGSKTFTNCWEKVLSGKEYNHSPFDRKIVDKHQIDIPSKEQIAPDNDSYDLLSQSSANIQNAGLVDYVITDPPYAGNVNYSELSDFFYVWLRLALKDKYPQFMPEFTPKVEEVIENKTRGKSSADFKEGLKNVFMECNRVSKDEAPLIFTFHHAEDSAWEALLDAVCEAGYYIEAVYPIHGEAENSMHLMNNEAISYDLIHICKKRVLETNERKRSWAGVRQEVRQRAREEIKLIESGKYGNEKLTHSDVNILLIGKCLELYSKNFGKIVDYQDKPLPLHEALKEIKMMVDQLVSKDNPLPPELENIDVYSYIYFTTLMGIKEIKVDEVSKNVKGIIDPSELKERGLIIKRRETRDRTYYVKQPLEKLNDLRLKLSDGDSFLQPDLFGNEGKKLSSDVMLIDVIYLLIGISETGDNLLPWLEKFAGLKPEIRASMDLFIQNNQYIVAAKRVLGLIDDRTLFTKQE